MLAWIRERAQEPSTWRGLALLLAVVGIPQAEGIVQHASIIVVSGIGLFDTIRKGSKFGQKP
jgi:hypothetical protein